MGASTPLSTSSLPGGPRPGDRANSDGKDRTDRLRREAAEIREDQQRQMEKRSGTVQMVFIAAIVGGLLPLMVIPFVVPFAQAMMSNVGFLG